MKVRHTTRCAGGCGRLLTVGQAAQRRHRTLWCPECEARHAARCEPCAAQLVPTVRVPVPAGQGRLF